MGPRRPLGLFPRRTDLCDRVRRLCGHVLYCADARRPRRQIKPAKLRHVAAARPFWRNLVPQHVGLLRCRAWQSVAWCLIRRPRAVLAGQSKTSCYWARDFWGAAKTAARLPITPTPTARMWLFSWRLLVFTFALPVCPKSCLPADCGGLTKGQATAVVEATRTRPPYDLLGTRSNPTGCGAFSWLW